MFAKRTEHKLTCPAWSAFFLLKFYFFSIWMVGSVLIFIAEMGITVNSARVEACTGGDD